MFFGLSREEVLERSERERRTLQEELGIIDRWKLKEAYESSLKAYTRSHGMLILIRIDLLVSIAQYEH